MSEKARPKPKPKKAWALFSRFNPFRRIGRYEFTFLIVVLASLMVASWIPKQVSEKWKNEKRAQSERRLQEHAGILAAHFNREIQRIRSVVGAVVEQSMVPNSPDLAVFSSDPVIRQLTLWEGNIKEGLKRSLSLNNSETVTGAISLIPPVPNDQMFEERLLGRMLDKTLLFARATSNEGKAYGLMALVLPYWKSRYGKDAVVVASIDMKFFYLPIPTPVPPTYFIFFGRNSIFGFGSTEVEQHVAEKIVSENYPLKPHGYFTQIELPGGQAAAAVEPFGNDDFQVVATEEVNVQGLGLGVEAFIFLAIASLFVWTILAAYFAFSDRFPLILKRIWIEVQRAYSFAPDAAFGFRNMLPPGASPLLCRAVVLHGGLHHLNPLIEKLPPQEVFVLLSDFFLIGRTHIAEFGGYFEKYGESSFTAYWVGDHEESAKKAMGCALAIRNDLISLNESRKNDGQPMLWAGVGLHVGTVAMGAVMSSESEQLSAVGEVVNCARALMHLSADGGMNLLISHDLYLLIHTAYQTQMVDERRLTQDTGVTKCYSVTGYRQKGEGADTVHLPASPTAEASQDSTKFGTMILNTQEVRWTVNNGSQIVGPFDDQKIAQMLFSQEIDFETECWSEKDGKRSTIAFSGIFKGSEDPKADLWVYDLKTVHGPLTPSFVLAAMTQGALPTKSWVCQKSTINGWIRVKDFIQSSKPPVSGQPPKLPSGHQAA